MFPRGLEEQQGARIRMKTGFLYHSDFAETKCAVQWQQGGTGGWDSVEAEGHQGYQEAAPLSNPIPSPSRTLHTTNFRV